MAEPSPVIRIAVIGGGLAGATMANALLRHAHLEVHVYESAPEFSERGAAVGIPSYTQAALQQVVGVSEAGAMLRRAGAVLQASSLIGIVSKNKERKDTTRTRVIFLPSFSSCGIRPKHRSWFSNLW